MVMRILRRGLSVIEVILASTLIATILVATTSILPTTIKAIRVEQDISSQEHFARNAIEYVRSIGFDNLRDACVQVGDVTLAGNPATVTCEVVYKHTANGVVAIQPPSQADPSSLWVTVSFWALNPDDGTLLAVQDTNDLHQPGGATIATVRVGMSNGTSLYETMISQADSPGNSNYEIVVEGLVIDDLGQPIPDADVYFTSVDPETSVQRHLKSDTNGRFTTRVPRGYYTVVATKPYYYASPLTSIYIDVSNPFQLTLTLERRITVRGRVTDDLGNNLDSIQIDFTRKDTGETYNVVTGTDGRYESVSMRPGVYDVKAYLNSQSYRTEVPITKIEDPTVLTVVPTENTPDAVYDIEVLELAGHDVIQSDQFPTNRILGWIGSFTLRTINGAQATVTITDRDKTTLADYAAAINAQAGNVAKASVISGRLVIEANQKGEGGRFVWTSNSDPDYILYSLGIINANGFVLAKANSETTNAVLRVNGTTYSRNKNTGITDVIDGVSLDVKGVGSSTVTVDVTQSSGSETARQWCRSCLGTPIIATKYVTIPTPGPVTITWEVVAGPPGCFIICVQHQATVEIWGPNNFHFRRSVTRGNSDSGTTTVVIQPNQVGTYTLQAKIATQNTAHVTVSWNHDIRNVNSSNPNVLAASVSGQPTAGTYTVYVDQLAGYEIVRGSVFDTSTHLRWIGSFTINGRTVTITNPNATRLSDYATAINQQAGDVVTATVENGKLVITAKTQGTSLTFTDPDLILVRLGILRNTGTLTLRTKNLVQRGTDAFVRVNGTDVRYPDNTMPNVIPAATVTVLKKGKTKVELARAIYEANPYEILKFELDVQGNPADHTSSPYQEKDITLERLYIVHGIVKDDRGLPVPSAEVNIEHLATGTNKRTLTDDAGAYFVPEVKGGQVRITVSKDNGNSGWKTYTGIYNITKHTHQKIDFTLTYRPED